MRATIARRVNSSRHRTRAALLWRQAMPVIALEDVSTAFGHVPLLDHAGLLVEPGERVAVIGRNGAGKSTLLRDPRRRARARSRARSGARRDCARRGSSRTRRRRARARSSTSSPRVWVICASSSSPIITPPSPSPSEATDEPLRRPGTAAARARGARRLARRAARRAGPDPLVARSPTCRSTRCQAAGAGACCWPARSWREPTLLLLDEPTNHLDIEAIEWLEAFLVDYAGAIVFVTHDRAFLERLATRIVELDRGRADVVARRLRDLRREEGGVARERSDGGREVRQAAGAGRSLAATRRQGAAHPRRRTRPRADGDARGARRATRRDRQRAAACRGGRAVRPHRLRGERRHARRTAAGRSCAISRRASCAAIASG